MSASKANLLILAEDCGDKIGKIAAELHEPVKRADGAMAIPSNAMDVLTEATVTVIAEAIQRFINAGSERDVTMGDETLFKAVKAAYEEWGVFV